MTSTPELESARIAPPQAGSLHGARLGIICSMPTTRGFDGTLRVNHAIGVLLEELLAHAPGAKLCIPLIEGSSPSIYYPLCVPPQDITFMPPLASVIQSQRHFFATRRIVRHFAKSVDLLFMRLPFQIPLAVRRLGKPKLMHIISNPGAIISASSDYQGLKKFVAQQFANHSMATMRRMAQEPNTRVASNGREMFEYLKPHAGRVVVSSCIRESEMRPRTDLRLASPPRLLFVGYLRPEKGVHTLLDAFEAIRRHRALRLTLVGGTDKVTQAEAQLRDRIAHSPFKDDITLTGLVPFGDPLFDLYRSHDVYVLPSLSEGTPRTLVEARAFGCPVVATRVGGIPTSVVEGQDGLLCDPNAPEQLAAAIERVLDDEPLRLGLIEQGLQRARQLTVEAFAGQLVEELAALVRECGLGNPSTNRFEH